MSDNLNQEVAKAVISDITTNKLLRDVEISKLAEKLHVSIVKEEDWLMHIENTIETELKASDGVSK